MCPSVSGPDNSMVPDVREPPIQPTRGPPVARGDPADAVQFLAQDYDRIAVSMNDLVIRRIFAAGLSLHTAVGLIGSDHPAAGKVREAIGELDIAIRDIRTVLFDDVTAAGTSVQPAVPNGNGRTQPSSG
jgi:hypothetical protein